jgi:hypothetical protein
LFARDAERFPTVSHYNNKRIVKMAGMTPAPAARLRLLCVVAPRAELQRTRHVTVRQLSPRDALMRLVPMAFHLDVQDRTELQRTFERLSTIVERVPVAELSYPWRLSALPRTAQDVLAAVSQAR